MMREAKLMKPYMVIERFKPGKRDDVYERFHRHGRMLPEGLVYIAGWTEEGGNRCFQLMHAKGFQSFESWISRWNDLIDFEIVLLESSSNIAIPELLKKKP